MTALGAGVMTWGAVSGLALAEGAGLHWVAAYSAGMAWLSAGAAWAASRASWAAARWRAPARPPVPLDGLALAGTALLCVVYGVMAALLTWLGDPATSTPFWVVSAVTGIWCTWSWRWNSRPADVPQWTSRDRAWLAAHRMRLPHPGDRE